MDLDIPDESQESREREGFWDVRRGSRPALQHYIYPGPVPRASHSFHKGAELILINITSVKKSFRSENQQSF